MRERPRWAVAPPAPAAALRALGVATPLTAQLLWNRGLRDAPAAERFLRPLEQPLGEPQRMAGVPAAVATIRSAIADGQLIAVHGDYDVDGVAATAVLVETLRLLGADPVVHIPHRVRDGYGLSPDAVRSLVERGVGLILTVDCGITANAEVALATSLGARVVVTDHHHVPVTLPAAAAVINPRQPGCEYGFRELAGCGVAFVLARALLQDALQRSAAEQAADRLLDLVALGTIADLVPLRDENRTLVTRGLRVLNAATRPGVRALMAVAGVRPGAVTCQQVAFTLTPRLNAAGRMAEAQAAYALLVAPDQPTALPLAERLGVLNRERQAAVTVALADARQRRDPDAPAIVIAGDYAAGIAGLVAGRLAEESGRPVVVLERGPDLCKGSARSPDGLHLAQALDACADLLVKYGGHAQAAGLTLATSQVDAFTARFGAVAEAALASVPPAPRWRVDGQIALRSINWAFAVDLERLEPYGMGNPVPLFLTQRVEVRDARPVGSTAVALRLADGGVPMRAIGFGMQDAPPRIGSRISALYEVERREWNGEVRLELCVRDWEAAPA